MDIVVCVKQIVDTEAVIELDGNGEVITEGQTLVIDPYSEFAVERAVQLTEEVGGSVTLVCVGDEGAGTALRHGLAMGAASAVLVEDAAGAVGDAAACAAQLAQVIEPLGADLILGGWKSGDTASAQVMGRLAVLLNLPFATMATGLEPEGAGVRVTCEVDDGITVLDMPLPCVVAAQQGLAEPRYPSVRDVMQARRKPLEVRPLADLPATAPALEVVSRTLKPARGSGRIVEGSAAEAAAETARLLAEEAKVI